MASLPVKDEGGSGALDTILGSPVEPKLQNLDSLNPAGLVPTDIGLPPRRRPLPPEKSSVQSILRSQSQQQVATLSPPAGQFLINTVLQAIGIAAVVAFGVYAVKSVTVGNSANQYADQAVQQAVTANQLAILAVCLSNGTQTADIASICSEVVSGAASVLRNAASMLFSNLPTSTSTASTTSIASTTSASSTTSTASTASQLSSSSSFAISTSISTPIPNTFTSASSTTSTASTASQLSSFSSFAIPTSIPTPSPTTLPSASRTGVTTGIVVGAIIGVILLSTIFYVTIRARRRRHAAAPAAAPTTSGPGALDVEADSSVSDSRGIVKVFRKLFVDSQVITHME